MVFGPQVTASLGSEAWQKQFDVAYNYQQIWIELFQSWR